LTVRPPRMPPRPRKAVVTQCQRGSYPPYAANPLKTQLPSMPYVRPAPVSKV
jgi:hypothetical protein